MAHQSVAERSPTNSSMFSSLPASSPVSSDESTVGNGSDYPVDQGDKVKKELISSDTMDATVAPEEETGRNSTRALALVLLSVALSLFLGSLDMTVVATALPTVARELKDIQNLSWVATSYMLTQASPQALWGRISDIFGRRTILLLGIFLFVAASAVCGAAPNMTVLIVARAIQGIGGGALNTCCFIVVSEVVPVRQRGVVQGGLQVVFAVSSIVGPLLGGLFSDSVGWRWIFWINLPIGAFSFLGIFFFLRLPNKRSDSLMHKFKTLDWFGVFTITTGSVLLLIGLTFGGQPNHGWRAPETLVCLILGVLFYPLFGFAELKAAEPMIPLHLFKVRNFWINSISAFIMGLCLFAPVYYIPLWFQIVRESSATNAGLSFLPAFVTSTLGGFISGGLITKYGIVIPYFRVGWFIISLGTGLDALWSGAMPYWQQALLLAFSGTGFGMGMVCIMIIVQASVDGKDIGPATTFIGFLETMGGIIGLAILNVILAQEMTTKLPPRLYEIGDRYAVPRAMMDYASQAVLGGRPSDTLKPVQNFLIPGSPVYNETVEAMQSATNDAFKIIFIMVGVIGAIPLVLSIWLQKPNLSGGTLAVLDGERKPADEEVNLDQTISITSADVVENGVKADKL